MDLIRYFANLDPFDHLILVTAWSVAAAVWGTGHVLSRAWKKNNEESDDEYLTSDYCTTSDDSVSIAKSKSQIHPRKSIIKSVSTHKPVKKEETKKQNHHTCLCSTYL
ncbi:hypothetical protein O0L34_g18140 [Tuta absoluta]|nr:hypothetical protein O0L34_g18140 [Tuta absoluta]